MWQAKRMDFESSEQWISMSSIDSCSGTSSVIEKKKKKRDREEFQSWVNGHMDGLWRPRIGGTCSNTVTKDINDIM